MISAPSDDTTNVIPDTDTEYNHDKAQSISPGNKSRTIDEVGSHPCNSPKLLKRQKDGIPSPLLMPPPSTHFQKKENSVDKSKDKKKSSKLVYKGFNINNLPRKEAVKFLLSKRKNTKYTRKLSRYSVPAVGYIRCSTNTGEKKLTVADNKRKIFTKPEDRKKELRGEMVSKGNAIPSGDVKQMSKYGKINCGYFKGKKKEVPFLNVEDIERPMRSSTPTPSLSTIEAGNLDVTSEVDEVATPQSSPNKEVRRRYESDSSDDEIFDNFTRRIRARERQKLINEERQRQIRLAMEIKKETEARLKIAHMKENRGDINCASWIGFNSGISTNNTDRAPSLYNDSLLDENCQKFDSLGRGNKADSSTKDNL